MPAIRRRRGSAAILLRGLVGGLPFCSGGNLRIGSAIALFLSRRLDDGILDRVTNVLLDLFELGEQAVGIGGIDAYQRGRGEFGTQPGELAEQGAVGLLQIETVDAAVGFVPAALDPAIVAELVDQSR